MKALEFKWTTSRARDSYGYNICTLFVDGRKAAACNGGGYDMKGTSLGSWVARAYADRLLALRAEDMPENSHWQPDNSAWICRSTVCVARHIRADQELAKVNAEDRPNCIDCDEPMERDGWAGEHVNDGRYFYGLTYHDPNFDPGKAVIGQDYHDRTMGQDAQGKTVAEAEAEGKSLGLERYQAFYRASSKAPTDRHTVPLIDGGCGFSSVEKIMAAIGLSLQYVRGGKRDDLYLLHDKRENQLTRCPGCLSPNCSA